MTPPQQVSALKLASVARAAGLCASAITLLACGPDFPNSFLLGGDAALLKAPVLTFTQQLEAALPSSALQAIPPIAGNYHSQTLAADLEEIQSALENSTLSADEREDLIAAFTHARQRLAAHDDLSQEPGAPSSAPGLNLLIATTSKLSPELSDYLQGAIAFHQGDTNAAQQHWEHLLARPEAARPYRSVWAAFMLGKIELARDPESAAKRFRQTRELAARGFKDPLGLAAASLGWEAQAELKLEHWTAAIRLYLQHAATGDPSAYPSLRIVCEKALQHREQSLRPIASDPTARSVMTAYFVSHNSDEPAPAQIESSKEWLALLETETAASVPLADRLALQAYQRAQFDIAQRWINRASTSSPLASWLQAKLLLRQGRLEDAAKKLANLARRFPPGQSWPPERHPEPASSSWDSNNLAWQIQGEFGTLQLSQREYATALDALLRAGFWMDASYIAERVLTPAELKQYVDRAWPAAAAEPENPTGGFGQVAPSALGYELRYLLGRRLARAGQWAEARPYLPAACQQKLSEFLADAAAGRRPNTPPGQRAAALWRAAQIIRQLGLELLGTELEPDWKIFDGNYTTVEITGARLQRNTSAPSAESQPFPTNQFQLAIASPDEKRRLVQHAPQPDLRFHYRYQAADLAWEAAALMPDNTDPTAQVLCTAGNWLKNRDPKAADRFYKALVRRCRKTKIGKEAERIRWFPLLDQNGNIKPPAAPDPGPIPAPLPFPLARENSPKFLSRFEP